MKKSILVFLFVLVLAAGTLTITAATETTSAEKQQLLCTTSSGNRNIKAMDNYSINLKTDGGNSSLYLYYGTVSGTQTALTTGTLTSSANAILSVEKKNNETQWRIYPKKCGTATLTYTDGTVTYTGTVQVTMPSNGFFSEQEYSEETHLTTIEWPVLSDSSVWVISKKGYAETDEVTLEATDKNGTTVSGITYSMELRAGNVHDLKLILPTPEGYKNNQYTLKVKVNNKQQASATVRTTASNKALFVDDNCIVGFATYREDILIIAEGVTQHSSESFLPQNPNEPYVVYTPFTKGDMLAAAEIKNDTAGAIFYEPIKNGSVSIKATKLRIEPLEGDEDTFSLSKTEFLRELSGSFTASNWPTVYFKQGVTGVALLRADIEATVNGQPVSGEVRMLCRAAYIPTTTFDCDAMNILTAEDLNNLLEQIAASLNTSSSAPSTTYEVNLAAVDYIGTVNIPSAFSAKNYMVLAGKENDATRLIGGIDLCEKNPGVQEIRNITFIAPEHVGTEISRAIYNGSTYVRNCVFFGYDFAVDTSSFGIINPIQCVFINNNTAIRVNTSLLSKGMRGDIWKNNTFLNNGTAVQVLSLNSQKDFLSPYNFRIYDSNFINNGIDIDARSGGTLYMYRNYFGEYKQVGNGYVPKPGVPDNDKHNGPDDLRLAYLLTARTEAKINDMLHHRPPKLSTENNTKIVTNPRWKYPVLNWWTGASLETLLFGRNEESVPVLFMAEADYRNILVADWELPTIIDNEAAAEIPIDNSAFDAETEGKKKIDVVDPDENPLGTWIFD